MFASLFLLILCATIHPHACTCVRFEGLYIVIVSGIPACCTRLYIHPFFAVPVSSVTQFLTIRLKKRDCFQYAKELFCIADSVFSCLLGLFGKQNHTDVTLANTSRTVMAFASYFVNVRV